MPISGENDKFTCVRCRDNDEWLRQRTLGVGGSDVAAIMGISPWKSPLEVWLEKTGRADPEDISDREPVRMGNELEGPILRMYGARHPERGARRCNAVLRSLSRPWAQASLDGVTRDPDLGWGVLEIKTGGSEAAWAEGVPPHYLAQVTHYMSVTGYAFADVAALVGDRGLHYHEYRVLRDEGDLRVVEDAVDGFWHGFVETGAQPGDVVGLPSESRALWRMHQSGGEGVREAPDFETMAAVDRYAELAARARELKEPIRELERETAVLKSRIKAAIGDGKGISTPEHVVTWVRSEARDGGLRVRGR